MTERRILSPEPSRDFGPADYFVRRFDPQGGRGRKAAAPREEEREPPQDTRSREEVGTPDAGRAAGGPEFSATVPREEEGGTVAVPEDPGGGGPSDVVGP